MCQGINLILERWWCWCVLILILATFLHYFLLLALYIHTVSTQSLNLKTLKFQADPSLFWSRAEHKKASLNLDFNLHLLL